MIPQSQFIRLQEHERADVVIEIDGMPTTAKVGDTLLTAMLLAGRSVRAGDFNDGMRAGFCLMGACQDCWVWLADGSGRVRACTTPIKPGMKILTGMPELSA